MKLFYPNKVIRVIHENGHQRYIGSYSNHSVSFVSDKEKSCIYKYKDAIDIVKKLNDMSISDRFEVDD